MATIKAGTYLFVNTPTAPTFDITGDVIPISIISNGESYNYIAVEKSSTGVLLGYFQEASCDNGVVVYACEDLQVFAGFVGWLAEYRTVTVTEDTEVESDDLANWFSYSTIYEPVLIKAGTYRWNDSLQLDDNEFDVDIPFTTPTVVINGETVYLECNRIVTSTTDVGYYAKLFINNTAVNDDYSLIPVYNSGDVKWNFVHNISEGEYPEGYGQIITITSDQYVPTNFGLWATSNWQPQSEPSVPMVTLKAGIYKFNHTLKEIDKLKASFCFYTPYVNHREVVGNCMQKIDVDDSWALLVNYTIDSHPGSDIAYTPYGAIKWGSANTIYPEVPLGYAQEILIPTTQEVPQDFYDWFCENTQKINKKIYKLNIDQSVFTQGGKCYKKLTKEELKEYGGNSQV